MLTPEELQDAQTVWKRMVTDGTAQEFVDEKESIRRVIGQTTTLVAYKVLK